MTTTNITLHETETPEQSPCAMKFSVLQEDLLRNLVTVMKSIPTRSRLPILAHIQIQANVDHITLSGTNLETAIVLQVEAEVQQTGTWTINAKTFLDCVKTFSKGQPVTIETAEERIIITCGKRTFTLKDGTDGTVFPVLPGVSSAVSFVLPGSVLCQAIKEVQFAAATDGSRPVFTAVCMHVQETGLNLVTVDAFRMAIRTIALPQMKGRDVTVLVPVQSMQLLADIMPPHVEVSIAWGKERVTFAAGHIRLVSRLVEGTYPNYMAALPRAHQTTFTLARADLVSLLHAFKPFTRDSSNILHLSYASSGSVTFSASSDDIGEVNDELATEVEGEDGHIFFNAEYLSDVLKAVEEAHFTFLLSGHDRPCLIVPVGRSDYRSVLMPMSPNR